MRILTPILVLIFLFPLAGADRIMIEYPSVPVNGGVGYWYGLGEVRTNVKWKLSVNPGSSEIISFTPGFIPSKKQEGNIDFIGSGVFDMSFILSRPNGRGIYNIRSELPSTGSPIDVQIRIPKASHVLYSNLPVNAELVDNELIINFKQTHGELDIYYTTLEGHRTLSTVVAGVIYLVVIIPLLFLRRKKLIIILREGLKKDIKTPFFLSILLIISASSYAYSLGNRAPSIVDYILFIYAIIILISALLYIMSSSKKNFLKNLSFICGFLFWIHIAYQSYKGILISVIGAVLIYLILNTLSEDSDEARSDDTGL